MRWFNPFPLDDETIDYNSFILFGESDNAFLRVIVILLVIAINMVIGCGLTILCLSIKAYITQLIHCMCCGFCDDCDCDYDGTQPSRTISNRYQHRRKGRSGRSRRDQYLEQQELLHEDNRTIDIEFTQIFKVARIICKRCMLCVRHYRFYLFLMLGVLSSYSVADDLLGGYLKEPETMIHSFSNYSVFSERMDDPRRVYFVTVSPMSGIQPARLTRIAQALYQHREFVTWIIVTTDPKRSFAMEGLRTEHFTFSHISKWKGNRTRVAEHLESVRRVVGRFGIPFVILSGYEAHHEGKGFPQMRKGKRRFETEMGSLGRYVGLLWATKTFSNGVLMVGDEDIAYNNRLFVEIRKTKLMSSWPTYSTKTRFIVGLYSPVKARKTISGYFEGGIYNGKELPLQVGNYALNMSFANRLRKANVLWKLAMSDKDSVTSKDIFIRRRDIQLLGNKSSEIYVWKLIHAFPHVFKVARSKIHVRPQWLGTNVDCLLEYIRKWFSVDLLFKNFFVVDKSKKKRYRIYH